jgi:hypothetical protein
VTLPFSDNFNRQDNFFLGAGWVQNLGDLANIGQAAQGTSATDIATLQSVSKTDVTTQTDVVVGATGVQMAGLVARYSGPGDSNMYWGAIIGINGAFQADIFRNLAGVWTELASTPVNTGTGTLRFDVVGPSMKLYLNGTLVTFANDTALTAPGSVGLRANAGNTMDNFSSDIVTLTPNNLPFSDNFNRPNGQLGLNWVDQLGDGQVQNNALVTHVVDPTSSDPNKSLAVETVNGVSAANVTVQADITLAATGLQYSGLVARYSGPGDQNMYWGGIVGVNGAFQAVIFRNVNGTWTQLNPFTAIGNSTTPLSGTVRFEVVGPSLKLFLNGTLVAFANDTVLTAPGTVGLRSADSITIDNFSASVLALNNVSLPFSDNFPTGTGQQLSNSWVNQVGMTLAASNLATGVASLNVATVNLAVPAADVAVQADIALSTSGLQYSGLVARYSGPGDQNMYWGAVVGVNGAFQAVIYRNVNGTWTQLNPFTSIGGGTGTLRFEVVGSSLKLFLSNTLIAFANDNVLTAPGTVGMREGATDTFANFSASVLTLNNPGLPFSDNFNAATNQQLSNSWLNQAGIYQVAGGVAQGAASFNLATVNGVSAANVFVQADINLGVSGLQYAGTVARYSGPADQNMYWGAVVGNNGAFQAVIYRNVNGTWTQLNPFTAIGSGTGTLRFEVVGSSLKLFLNNSLIAFANDTAVTAPGTVGIRGGADSYDNFSSDVLTLTNPGLPFSDPFNPTTNQQLSNNWLNQ